MAGHLHQLSTEPAPAPGGDGVGGGGKQRVCLTRGEGTCCAFWNLLDFISGLHWGMRGPLARRPRGNLQVRKPGHPSEGPWSPSRALLRPLCLMEGRGPGNPKLIGSTTCPKPHTVGEVALGPVDSPSWPAMVHVLRSE